MIDKLWENGTDDERKIIRAELFKFRGQLKGNMYGRIILRNCGLESFQLPHAVAGKDDSSRTEGFKADEERKVSVVKKKRKGNDLHMKEAENNIKNKKARNDFGSSYNDELLKLGVGICSNEDELKDPTDSLKVKNDNFSVLLIFQVIFKKIVWETFCFFYWWLFCQLDTHNLSHFAKS